jgi:hypothetical protein
LKIYSILKKKEYETNISDNIQETKGNASYGELSEYIKKEVSRSSLLKKSLQQTPHTNISPRVQEKWKTWSFR